MFSSIIIAVIAIALLSIYGSVRYSRVVAAALTFVLLILSGLYHAADYFTGTGIDESVVYHLQYGLSGAGYGAYIGLIISSFLFTIFAIYAAYLVLKISSLGSNTDSNLVSFLCLGIFIVSIVINPASKDLYKLYALSSQHASKLISSAQLQSYYVKPSLGTVSPPMNIVYIYLESLEQTYFDDALFPSLVPGLKSLEQHSTVFKDIRQIPHTGWTIAGMTASQCGVPLYTPSDRNSMSGFGDFLPGAVCIGDLLKAKGYTLNYLGGSSLDFAGKGLLYKTHGFADVLGREALSANLEDPEYLSSWGVYDDILFQASYKRFLELSSGDDPFGLFMLTLDTHHPNGHLSRFCHNKPYLDGSNSILNAVHCSDLLVSEFVRKIRESKSAENTLIVISSDHLAMKNTASSTLALKENRKNLFMVISPKQTTRVVIDKPGSMIDVSPTLLSLMGFDVAELGLGRDLMRSEPTLVEIFSDVNKLIQLGTQAFADFWNYPQLDYGLRIDSNLNQVQLGDRVVKIPVLFQLDSQNIIDEVKFENYSKKKLTGYVEQMGPDQRMIWFDFCSKISALTLDSTLKDEPEYCLAIGKIGAKELLVKLTTDLDFMTREEVINLLEGSQFDSETYAERIERIHNFEKYGTQEMSQIAMGSTQLHTGNLIVRSSAFSSGASYLESYSVELNKYNGRRVHLKRGISLIGVTESSEPVKLAHVDTCAPNNPAIDSTPFAGSFSSVIEELDEIFSAYVVVAHDSPLCDPSFDFNELFAGLPLEEWKNIKFRQGYIGLFSGNGESLEIIGSLEEAAYLHVTSFIEKKLNLNQLWRSFSSLFNDLDQPLSRISRAGGGYRGKAHTNSLDALNFNSDTYELLEIDFSWGSDDQLICLQDWEGSFEESFGLATDEPVVLSKFRKLVETKSDLEKCTLDSLIEWLGENKNTRIVTDVKENNIKALTVIASRFPEFVDRFVPQVYYPEEYFFARAVGYPDIIWTLYRFDQTDEKVLRRVKYMDLYAVTMPVNRANRGLGRRLSDVGVRSYVHAINDRKEIDRYKGLGIDEVYTDWLPESETVN